MSRGPHARVCVDPLTPEWDGRCSVRGLGWVRLWPEDPCRPPPRSSPPRRSVGRPYTRWWRGVSSGTRVGDSLRLGLWSCLGTDYRVSGAGVLRSGPPSPGGSVRTQLSSLVFHPLSESPVPHLPRLRLGSEGVRRRCSGRVREMRFLGFSGCPDPSYGGIGGPTLGRSPGSLGLEPGTEG